MLVKKEYDYDNGKHNHTATIHHNTTTNNDDNTANNKDR